MENPKCPYCGGEMEYQDQWIHPFYICLDCYSQSPRTTKIEGQEEAYAAAMKRDRAKGKWILVLEGLRSTTYRCSHCGNYFAEHSDTLNAGRGDKKFCPNCGADMREEENDER